MNSDFSRLKQCNQTADPDDVYGITRSRDVWIQIAFSVTLGLGGFLGFCVGLPALVDRLNGASLTTMYRSSGRDGRAYMPRARSRTRSRRRCPSSPIASLAGYCHYGGSPGNRCWPPLAWMHMWYDAQPVVACAVAERPRSTWPSSRWPSSFSSSPCSSLSP